MIVTDLSERDYAWVAERTELLFGGDTVISRDLVHRPSELPGFIAVEGSERIGLATFDIVGKACEVVTLDALCQYIGVGTALLRAVEQAARAAGCDKLWLITTNDNVDGLRFFQKRGFAITAFRIDGMKNIREVKPRIPLTGYYDIPIRDEIELEKPVRDGDCWLVE